MNVNNIKGRPKFTSGQFLGYILWKQTDGFHLRWTTKRRKAYNFQGKIVFHPKLKITKIVRPETGIKIHETGEKTIQWNTIEKIKINGLDFVTPGNFTLELRINKKKIKPKSIFLGSQMKKPESNPFTITQITTEEKLKKEVKRKLKQKIKEPSREIEPAPIYELIPELKYEPIPEPEPEPVYEPTPEPEPESVYEPTPEPEPEPVYEPIPEPEPKPVYEPIPEPEPEPVYEPTPEPEPEPV